MSEFHHKVSLSMHSRISYKPSNSPHWCCWTIAAAALADALAAAWVYSSAAGIRHQAQGRLQEPERIPTLNWHNNLHTRISYLTLLVLSPIVSDVLFS